MNAAHSFQKVVCKYVDTQSIHLMSVGIVTESISDHIDTNKRNNCLSLIYRLK